MYAWYVYIGACKYMYVYVQVNAYACMHACVYVCMCASVYVCVWVSLDPNRSEWMDGWRDAQACRSVYM